MNNAIVLKSFSSLSRFLSFCIMCYMLFWIIQKRKVFFFFIWSSIPFTEQLKLDFFFFFNWLLNNCWKIKRREKNKRRIFIIRYVDVILLYWSQFILLNSLLYMLDSIYWPYSFQWFSDIYIYTYIIFYKLYCAVVGFSLIQSCAINVKKKKTV